MTDAPAAAAAAAAGGDAKAEDGKTADGKPAKKAKTEEEKKAAREKKKKRAKEKKAGKWVENTDHANVYVTGLPFDITMEEMKETFKKGGIIKDDPDNEGQPKIKLYKDAHGIPKGDGTRTHRICSASAASAASASTAVATEPDASSLSAAAAAAPPGPRPSIGVFASGLVYYLREESIQQAIDLLDETGMCLFVSVSVCRRALGFARHLTS